MTGYQDILPTTAAPLQHFTPALSVASQLASLTAAVSKCRICLNLAWQASPSLRPWRDIQTLALSKSEFLERLYRETRII